MHGSIRQALLAGGIVLLTTNASASPPPVALVWDAPPECPGAADVFDDLADISDERWSAETHVDVHGTITKVGSNEFRLVVEATAGNVKGVRTVTASTCGSLSIAAAIIIAAVLADGELEAGSHDDARSKSAPLTPPRDTQAPAVPFAVAPVRPPTSSPESPPDRAHPSAPPTMGIQGGAALDVGTLPRPAPGVALSVVLEHSWVQVGLLASAYLPEELTFETRSHPSARFAKLDGGVYGCVPWRVGGFRIGPCSELGLSRIAVTGVQVSNANRSNVVVPTLGTGMLAEMWFTSQLYGALRLDAIFPIGAPPIGLRTTDGPFLLHELALPAFRGLLGVGVTLR